MNQQRNKELKAQYKEMKPEMGIAAFTCNVSGQVYLWAVKDTKGKVNGMKARLNGNMYRAGKNKQLQDEWNKFGESQFEIQILDILEYEKDETKTDYTEELEMLLEDWEHKYKDAVRIG